MKKLDYVSPEIESIKLYSGDEINTGDIFDPIVSNGTPNPDWGWD